MPLRSSRGEQTPAARSAGGGALAPPSDALGRARASRPGALSPATPSPGPPSPPGDGPGDGSPAEAPRQLARRTSVPDGHLGSPGAAAARRPPLRKAASVIGGGLGRLGPAPSGPLTPPPPAPTSRYQRRAPSLPGSPAPAGAAGGRPGPSRPLPAAGLPPGAGPRRGTRLSHQEGGGTPSPGADSPAGAGPPGRRGPGPGRAAPRAPRPEARAGAAGPTSGDWETPLEGGASPRLDDRPGHPLPSWDGVPELFSGLPTDGPAGRRLGRPPGSDVDEDAPGACAGAVSLAARSRIGWQRGRWKSENQDAYVWEELGDGALLLGVFDGHGRHGRDVARVVARAVAAHGRAVLAGSPVRGEPPGRVRETVRGVFELAAQALRASGVDAEESGTTAAVAVVDLPGRRLVTAWCGDSRAVLGRGPPGGAAGLARALEGGLALGGGASPPGEAPSAVDLTADHKPDNPGEKARVLAAGGRVLRGWSDGQVFAGGAAEDASGGDESGGEGEGAEGVWRIFLPRVLFPGLATSRAFGDWCACQVGVTSDPDVRVREVTAEDRWVVLGSDGLWEVMSSQEAVERCWASRGDPGGAAEGIVAECLERWAKMTSTREIDDITCIVAELASPLPPAAGAKRAGVSRASSRRGGSLLGG